MKPRSPALAFALMFAAALLCWALPAQQAPPPQKQEPPQTDAQLGPLGDALKQKAAEKAIGSLLDSQLPLKLDAKTLYPTVSVLPGGPFAPRPLVLSPASLNRPLPPGDYTLPVFAFCTEYSVHRPGTGVAYELAPMQGKAAHAIWALLWRGTIEKRRPPAHLLAVSWAIQSGITYARMPRTYQAVVDDVIPEYRGQLNGDFMQNLEDVYQSYARGAHLPPLEQLLARMGKAGELALAARRQRQILLAQNVNDERKTQTLFVGQEKLPAVGTEGQLSHGAGVAHGREQELAGAGIP